MAKLINQYSFVFTSLFLLGILAYFLLRDQPKTSDYIALAVVAVGLAVAWFLTRPQQSIIPDSAAEVQAMIGQGTPVLLEFQSPF